MPANTEHCLVVMEIGHPAAFDYFHSDSVSSSCLWSQSSSSNAYGSSFSNFFGCPGRAWSSKPKSPLLNRS